LFNQRQLCLARGVWSLSITTFCVYHFSPVYSLCTAEAISNALPGCKWQNLPFAERKLLEDRSSLYPQFRVVKADKGLGPGVVSDSMYYDALKRTLYDKANTYEELIGITTDAISSFQNDGCRIQGMHSQISRTGSF
jgi:hypothetical protein